LGDGACWRATANIEPLASLIGRSIISSLRRRRRRRMRRRRRRRRRVY